MATNDWTTSDYPGYGQEPELMSVPAGAVGQMTRRFVCSTTGMTGSDVYKIFKVGLGMIPLHFVVNVETAEGGAATLDIGDGDLTTRYETDADLNATGVTSTLDATKEYTADDTIDIIPSATLDTAVFTVTMVYLRTRT